ncbi:MAG: 16S rRNA (guanine(527)-N(7))-methyltransferase RsmG [Ezakiella sp.]|nr:16S rRNA (guanine(527)-N(7))-methyltransferase RsmG [Ezakiella sp.]MDD7472153.1 16S rRNA (guanine(527)-N(7))-methyltransferase RsmG [Bacillota bacterium]MDY3923480.1 16S rRNA (guanine(527)-N(7))-methyltransferase RsmG [Ezakiella sp.]
MHLSNEENIKIDKYLELMVKKNEVMNLTAITDEKEMKVKHVEDSLTVLEILDELKPKSLVDVGTGAGLPGMIIKITRPEIEVLLIDSLNKRIKFLDEVIYELELKGISTMHARAEEAARKNADSNEREKFDVAISRAVARLNTLLEYNLPFVKLGGHMIAMKGPGADEEIGEAKKALEVLGGKLEKVKNLNLSNGDERNIVLIKKIKPTPQKYPRTGNKPKTNPL